MTSRESGYIIRRARAGDSPAIAELIYTAAQSHLRLSAYDPFIPGPLGKTKGRLAEIEKLVVVDEPTHFHYSGFLLAEADGRVAAGLCGFNPARAGAHRIGLALLKIGWTAVDIQSALDRVKPIRTCAEKWPEPAQGWVIENVATFPEYRRRGLASALISEVVARGKRLGYSPIRVSVFIGNDAAQRVYETAGFRVVDEARAAEFERALGSPGVRLMLLKGH